MLTFEKQIIAGYIKTDHRRAMQTCARLGKPTQSRYITLHITPSQQKQNQKIPGFPTERYMGMARTL